MMIDYPDAIWTKPQLTDQLSQIAHLFQSPVFKPSAPFTPQSQARWLELILAISALVRQASLRGKRIDFTDEVGADGKPQDITSLLDVMRQSAFVISPVGPTQRGLTILSPGLNYFYGAGSGCFSNGLAFSCEHKNEQAFFIGRDRVYFYRHLMRAFIQAGRYLVDA
ncbi:hypothetical protein HNV11_11610 [Spirosoma taeanense]|uniref:Uncharacterized protein n=1 Tax=Spirosoma taeanense TaxID=2735870 RepID=A0A6M5Y9D0_9BACT|nr:hypothetical protein [Spirosoma taeanense]QJW89976.1 hypothetical protein HNV11_11610 [Spirosoma taeanense]